jgi:diguanylate cyclase (GGDEF)-like protein
MFGNDVWRTHSRWLITALLTVQCLVIFDIAYAPLKYWHDLDWLDIAGEGGTTALVFGWFLIVLSSRPAGKVTNYFAAGLLGLFVGTLQDFLDELLQLSNNLPAHGAIESFALPFGMFALTAGLYHWRKEQLSISMQLRKREQLFRQLDRLDPVTQVSDIDYMKQHIELALQKSQTNSECFALVLIDINGFHKLNNQFGTREGDKVLRSVSELLILNLRDTDLLCRYAGDRFAILLPATRNYEAEKIAQELCLSIQHFAYRSATGERIELSASAGIACARNDSLDGLLIRARNALLRAKESLELVRVAA